MNKPPIAPDLLSDMPPGAKRLRQSHIFAREQDDHYPEPLTVARALAREIAPLLPPGAMVLDPCCGWARIPRAFAEQGVLAWGHDIQPRWGASPDGALPPGELCRLGVGDGWSALRAAESFARVNVPVVDLVAFNPPYAAKDGDAEKWIKAALEAAPRVVAILRWGWPASEKRLPWLKSTPLRWVKVISPRPSLPTGRALMTGTKATGGTLDFGAFYWERGYRGPPEFGWLERREPKPPHG